MGAVSLRAAAGAYDRLLSGQRLRPSSVRDRSLEEEAESDRGRVLFSAPFRRLQDKAQVFSLEANAAVRSRLTHSLEVSSVGRIVARRALEAIPDEEKRVLGVGGKERAIATFVETACGLNLTATTLASVLKYPWSASEIPKGWKKSGYYLTESDVYEWIRATLGLEPQRRHPLVYLLEAADDIAYCLSDIEDGIEHGLIDAREFAAAMQAQSVWANISSSDRDVAAIRTALAAMTNAPNRDDSNGGTRSLVPMQDLRSGVVRFLAREAGTRFGSHQEAILEGREGGLLSTGFGSNLLVAFKGFAEASLYSAGLVRSREVTAHAVLAGLLDAYLPLMTCSGERFDRAMRGERKDERNLPIARDGSLGGRIAGKYIAVYRETVKRVHSAHDGNLGRRDVLERILRMRLVVDHIGGMTDAFALSTHQLVAGVRVSGSS